MNWQITQNIFFSMMSDSNQQTYYDRQKGDVVTYMDQYLIPLSQDNLEAFQICMERASRNEPPDRINPDFHKQIPVLNTLDFINIITGIIYFSNNKEFQKLIQPLANTNKHFLFINNNFYSTNLSTNVFQNFLDYLTEEVVKNKLGDQSLINRLYKETAEKIANRFVSAF